MDNATYAAIESDRLKGAYESVTSLLDEYDEVYSKLKRIEAQLKKSREVLDSVYISVQGETKPVFDDILLFAGVTSDSINDALSKSRSTRSR